MAFTENNEFFAMILKWAEDHSDIIGKGKLVFSYNHGVFDEDYYIGVKIDDKGKAYFDCNDISKSYTGVSGAVERYLPKEEWEKEFHLYSDNGKIDHLDDLREIVMAKNI